MGICITGVCGLIVYMVGIFSHFRGVDVELNELVGTWTWIHITYIRSYIQTARFYRHYIDLWFFLRSTWFPYCQWVALYIISCVVDEHAH
jgi:hypothetical protein